MNSSKDKKFSPEISPVLEAKVQLQLKRVSPYLRSFSLKLTGDESAAKDLYQDTALRIICNADKYTEGTNFKAWSMTIMRNIFINNYRTIIRRRTINDQSPNNYYLNSGDRSIENEGESRMAYKELLRMISALPEDIKRPFWMAYKGYKYGEIAEAIDAPQGTIKSRIFFARRRLQKMYEHGIRV